jgi:hypothetical protein
VKKSLYKKTLSPVMPSLLPVRQFF